MKNKSRKEITMKNRLQKSIVALSLLASLIVVGGATPATATRHSFSDVPDGQWYSEAVQFVYENNIMGGVGNNQFNPRGNLTRAEVTALLFRIHNGRTANASDSRQNNFTDVNTEWFAAYVTWASNNDIVNGTTATTFSPNNRITRQEFATMVYRYAIIMTVLDDWDGTSAQWSQFTDHGQIALWAQNALQWMN